MHHFRGPVQNPKSLPREESTFAHSLPQTNTHSLLLLARRFDALSNDIYVTYLGADPESFNHLRSTPPHKGREKDRNHTSDISGPTFRMCSTFEGSVILTFATGAAHGTTLCIRLLVHDSEHVNGH